jgi:hypothetical protein
MLNKATTATAAATTTTTDLSPLFFFLSCHSSFLVFLFILFVNTNSKKEDARNDGEDEFDTRHSLCFSTKQVQEQQEREEPRRWG